MAHGHPVLFQNVFLVLDLLTSCIGSENIEPYYVSKLEKCIFDATMYAGS